MNTSLPHSDSRDGQVPHETQYPNAVAVSIPEGSSVTKFDLRALVKMVCDNSAITNDDELVKEVLAKIAPEHHREALEQALPSFVQRFVSRDNRPLTHPQAAPVVIQRRDDDQSTSVADGGALPYRSRKVSAIRSTWQRQLRARVNVGHKTRKFFGDCTLDDLAFIAKHRRELAASNIQAAEYIDSLAKLMRELGVDTVRELPEDDVNGLGGAA